MTTMFWLTLSVLLLIIASLVTGVISMAKGGKFDQKHSEHFMYFRIGFQALAVLLLMQLAYMNFV
jgi:hypothetical protein